MKLLTPIARTFPSSSRRLERPIGVERELFEPAPGSG